MKSIDILYCVLLLVLIGLSATFSAADMAYSSVNKLRLEKRALLGDERAKKALHLANDYDKTIASVLFGNDFVNILSSSLASLLGADLLEPLLGEGPSALIASLSLLFLLLVFGEITPKAVAKPHSFGFARALTGFVGVIEVLFFPFVYPANFLAERLSSPLIEKAPQETQLASDEELQAMVDQIEKEGIIDEDQSELLHRSIEFKETSCYEIMTPRIKVFGYDTDVPFKEFLQSPEVFRHSRIPVFHGNLDNVLGYLPVKSLLRVLVKGEKPDLDKLILPVISVPRTMMISSTMALMKETHHHIAIVRDEFGGTEGIITLEDILEELVGEMWDEKDKIEDDIVLTGKKNVYRVKGRSNISDVFAQFHLDESTLNEDYTTLSGWINDQLGRFAQEGDRFSYESIDVKVLKCSDYTVKEVLISYHPRRKGAKKS